MKRYVVGFPTQKLSVLLIKKNRPRWQTGRYNGIGGHIEKGEKPIDAMVRECEEETGLRTIAEQWEKFVIYRGKKYIVHFFVAFNVDISQAVQKTDEELKIFDISTFDYDMKMGKGMIYNLNWLLPLAFDGAVKTPITIYEQTETGHAS